MPRVLGSSAGKGWTGSAGSAPAAGRGKGNSRFRCYHGGGGRRCSLRHKSLFGGARGRAAGGLGEPGTLRGGGGDASGALRAPL